MAGVMPHHKPEGNKEKHTEPSRLDCSRSSVGWHVTKKPCAWDWTLQSQVPLGQLGRWEAERKGPQELLDQGGSSQQGLGRDNGNVYSAYSFHFFLSHFNELKERNHSTGLSPSLNIWDTRWKVRSKLLQRNDCWNEGVGYQRRPGTKANSDPGGNQEQWDDPWSFLAFSSTPGKRVAHQLHWRISKQIAQLSPCFPASEIGWETWLNAVKWKFRVWGFLPRFGVLPTVCPDLQGYTSARRCPRSTVFLSPTWTYILSASIAV